jgi:hypothetical protein
MNFSVEIGERFLCGAREFVDKRHGAGLTTAMPKPRALVFLALALPAAGFALDIVKYNPAANDRFAAGFPRSPVPNTGAAFVARAFDFSGVGWSSANQNQNFTMINDRQFVLVSHYSPASDTVCFFSPALNSVVAYKIDPKGFINFTDPESGQKIDLQIGTLATPLDPAHRITTYPLLKLAGKADYMGLKLYVYGHYCTGGTSPVVGINGLDEIKRADFFSASGGQNGDGINDTTVFTFKQGSWAGAAWGETGDSASPTFAAMNGKLCLLGVHLDIDRNPNTTIDIFLPAYLDALKKAGVDFKTSP